MLFGTFFLSPFIFNVNYSIIYILIVNNCSKFEIAMKKPKDLNHPVKGSMIALSPIRNMNDVKSIQKILTDNPRGLLLFDTWGLTTACGSATC